MQHKGKMNKKNPRHAVDSNPNMTINYNSHFQLTDLNIEYVCLLIYVIRELYKLFVVRLYEYCLLFYTSY